jgi:hypothetical protein
LRELACTLLLAVVGERAAAFSQIGDGAIVISVNQEYETVFWPQSGEYINTTNFVTDDRWEDHLEFSVRHEAIDEVALFTDGLQALVLSYAEKRAHCPFFAPLFRTLRDAPSPDELAAPLRRFLDSPRVNDRTDDDKSLIVAARPACDAAPHTL